jgi:hypothetical protein
VPVYQQGWFKAALYSGLLLVIAVVFYVAVLKRPSADTLFQRAGKVMESGSLDEKLADRERGALAEYLQYYGEGSDEKTRKVREWVDALDREKCEKYLLGHLRDADARGRLDPEDKDALRAMKAEESGKLAEARTTWTQLLKANKDQKDIDKHAYALVAEDRLRQLDDVDAKEKALMAKITKEEFPKEGAAADDPEQQAWRALSLPFTDPKGGTAKARAVWQTLHESVKDAPDDPAKRPWLLLSAKHLRLFEKQPKTTPAGALAPRPHPEWLRLCVAAARLSESPAASVREGITSSPERRPS